MVLLNKLNKNVIYQVCALGRLLGLASIWWMVKSLGPAAPVVIIRWYSISYSVLPVILAHISSQNNIEMLIYFFPAPLALWHAGREKWSMFCSTPGSPCNALKPCRGTREDPVTNWSNRARLSSSKDSTAFQNHLTILLSGVQCFNLVFDFQSMISIFPRPQIMSWKSQ